MEVPPVRPDVAAPAKKELVAASVTVSHNFSGPIPPPDLLGKYEQLQPGLAERIVRMAEDEQKHRHDMEAQHAQASRQADRWYAREVLLGQVFALLIVVLAIGSGSLLAMYGQPLAGGIIGGGGVIGLASVFIAGRSSRKSGQATS